MAEEVAINTPEFYVAAVQTSTDGKDFQLIFTKRAVTIPITDDPINEPVVVLNMSRGSVVDMHESLGGLLKRLDKDFGKITTAYLMERKAAATAAVRVLGEVPEKAARRAKGGKRVK